MEVRFGIDDAEWTRCLQALPRSRRDALFGPAFHGAYTTGDDTLPHCSVVRDGDALLIIPGLRRAIPATRDRWDLQSCRAAGAGPVGTDAAADARFLMRAWHAWAERMTKEGGVAAFFRLHPVIDTARWLPASAEIRDDRPVAIVDLTMPRETIWRAAASQHRNMVRKAQREGHEIVWNDGQQEFEALYGEAMQRLDADEELRLSPAVFRALWDIPEVELAVARAVNTVNKDVIAGAVFLWSEACGHYLFAARRSDAGNAVSNLILDAAIERGRSRGIARLHLGGGRTPALADPLLRFKQSVSNQLVPFRVALVTADVGERERLNAAWAAETGVRPQWLLGYRQPLPKSRAD